MTERDKRQIDTGENREGQRETKRDRDRNKQTQSAADCGFDGVTVSVPDCHTQVRGFKPDRV